MKYQHPTIVIDTPAPGHYVITGHKPRAVKIPGEGTLVPSHECYISPEVPSDALQAILDDRESNEVEKTVGGEPHDREPKKRGRKAKKAEAAEAAETQAPEGEEEFK